MSAAEESAEEDETTGPDDEYESDPAYTEPSSPKLRRGLFGYRRADVEAEMDARATEIEELRDDMAALWLAFNQHERTLRDLIVAVERAGGPKVKPPGHRDWPDRPGISPEDRTESWMADQLEGLDGVLAAIKQATDALERGYAAQASPPLPAQQQSARPASLPPAPPTPARRPGNDAD